MQKERDKTLDCINHFLFQIGLGMQQAWILFWDCQEHKDEVIPYL
jgi:hypothetical protein